jgi:hypothetical protein
MKEHLAAMRKLSAHRTGATGKDFDSRLQKDVLRELTIK